MHGIRGNPPLLRRGFHLRPGNRGTVGDKIIAERMQFPSGPAKRPDLTDVIFSGGLIRLPDGQAVLYCGISDTEAHRMIIPDPFVS
nr:DUF1861 family protein [Paenibacillus humicola]